MPPAYIARLRAGRPPRTPQRGASRRGIWPAGCLCNKSGDVASGLSDAGIPLICTLRYATALISVKGVLGAQPLGYTAEIDFWHRGP